MINNEKMESTEDLCDWCGDEVLDDELSYVGNGEHACARCLSRNPDDAHDDDSCRE